MAARSRSPPHLRQGLPGKGSGKDDDGKILVKFMRHQTAAQHTFSMRIDAGWCMADVKRAIEEHTGYPAPKTHLGYRGRIVPDCETFTATDLECLRRDGGPVMLTLVNDDEFVEDFRVL